MKQLNDQEVYDMRLLRYQQNKSINEVARLTGHSLSTVSKYCWRDRDSHNPEPPKARAASPAKS